jgi:hypothetical protein
MPIDNETDVGPDGIFGTDDDTIVGDGLCNAIDPDDDNDGFPDPAVYTVNAVGACTSCEDWEDHFPWDPTEWSDNDMDGIGDNQDPDDDNDGVDDLSDVYPLDGTEWEDRNGDGLGDNANPLSLIDHMKLNPALTGVGAFALLAVIVGLVLMRFQMVAIL